MATPLSSLFGQSPIRPLKRHANKVHECASQLQAFFEAAFESDTAAMEQAFTSITTTAKDAAELKRDLRQHLPRSLFLPVSRSDLLDLLHCQDEIATVAKRIARLAKVRKTAFPDPLQEPLRDLLDLGVATSAQALAAINELDELLETGFSGRELGIVEEMIDRLDALESEADERRHNVVSAIAELEANLPPVDAVFLYQIAEKMGDLAEHAQSVGSRLQLLIAR